MKLTNILYKQHIGFHFKKLWHVKSKKAVEKTSAEMVLKKKGVRIFSPEEVLGTPIYNTSIDIKPDECNNEENSLLNMRRCLTYKDHNVLLEGLNQAKIITKTVELLDNKCNENINNLNITKDMDKQVKNIILASHLFDAEQKKLPIVKDPSRPAWNFPRTFGITDKRVNHLIITKLLHFIESHCNYDIVKSRHFLDDVHFIFPFEKSSDLYEFQLRGDFLLTSPKPLKPLTLQSTDDLQLPDIFPIKHTITLNVEQNYAVRDVHPIESYFSDLYPHTVFVSYNKTEVKNIYEEEITEEQIYGRSLLKAFTVAASHAKQRFGPDVKILPEPVTIQCLQTDGRLFHFGIFQLNTLDLEKGGIKNVWCQTTNIPLFESCAYQLGKPVLEGYNNDVVRHLFAFYKNV